MQPCFSSAYVVTVVIVDHNYAYVLSVIKMFLENSFVAFS